MVYVISKDGKPLMPCSNVVARLLLKDEKAKVIKRCPFTIKLKYNTTNYTQDCTLGIDTGSSHIGASVVTNNKIVYISDIEIRNDITEKMKQRSKYRRNRRNRKTRYRKARWLNRRNSVKKDRFSPTMISKINSHIKEIEYVKSIIPITKLILETGTFDMHLMKNPNMNRHWGYQKGLNYGFENTKAKVLNRDNYTCQCCKGKRKDSKLEVHHIIFRSQGGSDEENNLITLCHTCHKKLHNEGIKLNLKGRRKCQLKHATQMNSIRIQLLKTYTNAIETWGYVTKANRFNLGVNKDHYLDACVIANGGNAFSFATNKIIYKKCVSDGDYQQTKGTRSEQKIPTCKIFEFRKFDKVLYLNKEYFIKGRMSTGYAVLMDIHGNKIDFKNAPKGMKTPKLNNCKRIGARKTWIIQEEVIRNIV